MSGPRWTVYESPLGPLTLTGGPRGVTGLHFPGRGGPFAEQDREPSGFTDAVRQLDEYFAGRLRAFTLPLELAGTPFQHSVWRALGDIPYGATVSYAELARTIGRPDRIRAVGGAVGRTPVPIVVPWHRVVGSDGSLTGYGGGLHRKAALLDLESRTVAGRPSEAGWGARQLPLL